MEDFKEDVETVEEDNGPPAPESILPDSSSPTRSVSVRGGGEDGDEGRTTAGTISATLGAMVPLVGKLDMLLAPQGRSSKSVKDAIRLLKEDLEEISSYLEELSEVEDPPPTAMCWMNEARDLSYDVLDFIHQSYEWPEDPSIVAKTTTALKKLTSHGKTTRRVVRTISEFRLYVKEAIQRREVYGLSASKKKVYGLSESGPSSVSTLRRRYVSVGPMLPTPYEVTAEIVIDGRMNEFISSLSIDGDKQLKVFSVFGSACLGKTTLARVLYTTFGMQYNCRAFIRVSRKPDTKRIFRDMLSQLQGQHPPKDCKEIDLIDNIKKYLQDKRYLIIIDDVWTASLWNIISHAFPKGDYGSKIVTTTQIEDVALTCCHYQSEHVFEMKPLDEDHSRKLFFNRLYGSESHCPQQLKEILSSIVEICGGLPLATISIASLLASQSVITEDLLEHIYQSLSSCFSADSTSERMRQVLYLSYNNLPHHLKTCLLYLSMYPKGSTFCKDDLVKQWMAEVLINTKVGQDIKEVATSYLDELIGRRFIQPICINYNNEVVSCAVHDVVHDLIAHMSAEQNFIVAIDYSQMNVALSHKVRRLSLLFGDTRYAKTPANIRKPQVRSLTFFGLLECMPCIRDFRLLCVLNLQLSDHGGNIDPLDLTSISELFQLRYLKITSNVCIKLPKHGLQCLETLDITHARVAMDRGVPCVPYIHLPHLLHLSLSYEVNNMVIKSLVSDGKLKYLQDLHITTPSTSASYDVELIMGSLIFIISSGHQKLKTIVVRAGSSVNNVVVSGNDELSNVWNDAILPPLIQRFEFVTHKHVVFRRIPRLFDKHVNLRILKIEVRDLEMRCVDMLRGLPALTAMSLYVHIAPCQRIMFDKAGFSVLKYFKLRFTSGIAWLKFEADAMPNLWKLKLVFDAIPQMDRKLVLYSNHPLFEHHKHGTAVISIEHMPGLKEISVKFGGAAADVEYALKIGVTNDLSNPTINKQPVDYSYGDERSGLKQERDEILVKQQDEYDQKQPAEILEKQPDEYYKQPEYNPDEEPEENLDEPDEYYKQRPEENLDEEQDEILVEELDAYSQKQQDEYFKQHDDILEEEQDEYCEQQPQENLHEETDDNMDEEQVEILVKEAASITRIDAAHLFATQMETKQPAAREDAQNDEFSIDIESTPLELDTQPPPANWSLQAVEEQGFQSGELMLDLSRYILLLAVLVVSMTYAAAFSPPGGVWQDSDPATGRLAGDSIIRSTSTHRYLVFYYCNATAFASSLVVIVMVFFLALRHERRNHTVNVKPLQAAMVLDLLSVMGAYGAGTCRDKTTTIFSMVLVGAAFLYLVAQMVLASFWYKTTSLSINASYSAHGVTVDKRIRKVLMLLATFMTSFTYVAGMSTPGGFWDAGSGHPPGHTILGDGHGKRLTVFLCSNATAFVASLLIVVVLLDKRSRVNLAYGCITVALISLILAYTAGSCRESDTTVYVSSLVGAVLVFMIFLQFVVPQWWIETVSASTSSTLSCCTTEAHTFFWTKIIEFYSASTKLRGARRTQRQRSNVRKIVDKAGFLVLLLATLTATITYQAGLNPPGGVWPDNGGGHMAGDPILLTTSAKRFKAFFYCNSIAFAASLVAIILVQNKLLLETYVLEATMILELFGLMGAYAAGSWRDVNTSSYVLALAGAVLVYVVIHVVFFTLKHEDALTRREIQLVEKRRKMLLLFAVLAATITYQAGLSPPGGFRLEDDGSSSGHRAGDPNLLYNFPRRYNAFFYCNSWSFMLSIALIILFMNPHLYRPGIRSYALDICTAMSTLGLMGAYVAGSTQRLRTSIYTFVLLVVVLLFIAGLVLYNSNPKVHFIIAELLKYSGYREGNRDSRPKPENDDKVGKTKHAKRKYLMLLGILVASVTYQAGLSPPGGAWQSNSSWYSAGDPVMHDTMRPRYLVFFYSNSTSFVASIVVIVMLLPQWWNKKQWSLKVMNTAVILDFLALVVAYAAGSSRGWKTSMYVVALIAAMLAYVVVHIMLAFSCLHRAVIPQHESLGGQENAPQSHEQTNRRVQTPLRPMSLP